MAEFLLQHLLEKTVSVSPEETAVVDGDRSITYIELNRISNQVANQLINNGCKTGTTVAVYLPKSIEAIITFFGILKAGGAYVPLDAHYSPPNRIMSILELNKTGFLVTNKESHEKLSMPNDWHDMDIFFIDYLLNQENVSKAEINELNAENRSYLHQNGSEATPDVRSIHENCLAYVLYTSGSTGVPKGVMITHRNALTFINWALDVFKPAPGTVFANHAPFHFDLSVFDLFAAFAIGGTVHLVPSNVMHNPRALVEWIETKSIEIWYSVPSVWTTILNYAEINPTLFGHLKMILFAGEVFPSKYLKTLMHLFPDKRFFNLYGPTETNVCTYHEIRSVSEIDSESVPIGKACENTAVQAFDKKMQEVQVGETGELHVEGPGVCIGIGS
jgi:amino acid adenylation domain-containing protein